MTFFSQCTDKLLKNTNLLRHFQQRTTDFFFSLRHFKLTNRDTKQAKSSVASSLLNYFWNFPRRTGKLEGCRLEVFALVSKSRPLKKNNNSQKILLFPFRFIMNGSESVNSQQPDQEFLIIQLYLFVLRDF